MKNIVCFLLLFIVICFGGSRVVAQKIMKTSTVKLNALKEHRAKVNIEANTPNVSYSNNPQDPNIDPNNADNFDSMIILSDDGEQYLKIGCFIKAIQLD